MTSQDDLETFKILIEGAKDYAILMLDPKGKIVSWNNGAFKLLGYKEREIVNKHFSVFFTQEDIAKKLPQKELKTALLTGKAEDDNWIVRKDGSKFWGNGSTTPLFDQKKVRGFAKIFRDRTEMKELERRKDEFISIASHELRTPVATIKGFSQIIYRYVKDSPDELLKSYISKMESQVDRLTQLLDGLLDVSKIQSGMLALEKEKFDINELVKEITEDVSRINDGYKISVSGSSDKKVVADKYRIGQVITNLLSNAIKYSPRSKKVVVGVRNYQDCVKVKVTDSGIGISKKNISKIFERFFRVDNKIRESFSGLGLGLYISREIIKRHGGDIEVDSVKGRGSSFTFTLPTISDTIKPKWQKKRSKRF
jgi:PAS domain S-box-containing protein